MKKTITIMISVLTMFFSSVQAEKYIMLIGSNENDSSVLKILVEAGYTVYRGLGTYTGTLSQEKKDSLNNAALVIYSRNGASAPHGENLQDQWADIEAPILSLSPWIMRSNRWQWVNTTSTSCLQSDSIYLTEDGIEHPIFTGINVSAGGAISFTEAGITRNESFAVSEELTTGSSMKILATDATGDSRRIAIAEFEAGLPFYEGSPIPSSTRMFIAISEGDNCKLEDVRPNQMSAFNGTETGRKIFINAVKYLMGEEIVSGVKTLASKQNLKVFPNPANNYIYLVNVKGSVNYKVYNVQGAVVLKGICTNQINVASLPAGMYMIVTEGGLNAKFLKK